jgi:serine/threonine protein phosphatase PrpC
MPLNNLPPKIQQQPQSEFKTVWERWWQHLKLLVKRPMQEAPPPVINVQEEAQTEFLTVNSPPASPLYETGLGEGATTTYRSANHDAVAYRVCPGKWQAAILADGVGGGNEARTGEASQCVVSAVCMALEEGHLEINALFDRAYQALVRMGAESKVDSPVEKRPRNWLATTLIVVLEFEHEFCCGWVGDGAILHARGNLNAFRNRDGLPWMWMPLLSPHTIPQRGREALYRSLAPGAIPEAREPTVFRLRKDRFLGDVLLLATDGIYSWDKPKRGFVSAKESDERQFAIIGHDLLLRTHQWFCQLWEPQPIRETASVPDPGLLSRTDSPRTDSWPQEPAREEQGQNILTQQELQTSLSTFLQDLKSRDLLEDDTSLGILLSRQALTILQQSEAKPASPESAAQHADLLKES